MGTAASNQAAAPEYEGETSRAKYGVYCMKSNHQKVEDDFSAVPDLDGTGLTSFFGVYGGHGGSDIAKYCAKQFPIEVLQHQEYQDAPDNALESVFFRIDEIIDQSDEWRETVNPGGYTSYLKNGIWPFNQWPFSTEYGSEGTSACAVLIKGKEIIVGNVGDAQCLLSVKGQTLLLTHSHVPNDVNERERIQSAGGCVISEWWKIRNPGHRAGGLVALNSLAFVTLPISRSIGDCVFKRNKNLLTEAQIVTCEPLIKTVEISENTEFLVIASNGIWKCSTYESVADEVRQYLMNGETDLRFICKQVCLSAANTYVMRDTMTMILIVFKKDAKSDNAQGETDGEAEEPNFEMQGALDDELQPLLSGLSS